MSSFYKEFENTFRGDINQRLEVYQPYLDYLKSEFDTQIVAIDLGCGRGEWLSKLRDNNFDCFGCDLDDGMVKNCENLGLKVCKKNALELLKSMNDNSVHLISGFHFIEHIDFDILIEVVRQANRVLKDGGLLIFETPNPENIRVSTLYFYLDATHSKPIVPSVLDYIYKFFGFKNTFMLRLNTDKNTINRYKEKRLLLKDMFNSSAPDFSMIGLKNSNENQVGKVKIISDNIMSLNLSFDQISDSLNGEIFNLVRNFEQNYGQKLQTIEKIEVRLKAVEDFVENFRVKLRIFIKIFNLFSNSIKFLKSQIKKIIFFIFKKTENFIKSNPRLKSSIISILNKNKFLKDKIYRFRNKHFGSDIYIFEAQYADNFFEAFKTKEYLTNLAFKDLKFQKNYSNLVVVGHFSGSYSLSLINKNILFNYHEVDKNINIIPFETNEYDEIKNTENIDFLNSKITNEQNNENLYLYHHYPIIENVKPNSIALFFWEESKIPKQTIDLLNKTYKGIIVSTWFIKKTLLNNGCLLPIKVVDLPLKEIKFDKIDKKDNFITLFHISSCFPRKGVDTLLMAFNNLCKKRNDLKLLIKSFHNPHNNIFNYIEKIVDKEFRSKIEVILDELDTKQIHELYEKSDIVVLPTKGEGLNLPCIEASIHQKPIVVTNYGAQNDFLEDKAYFVDYQFAKAKTHLSQNNSIWVEPSFEDLAEKILLAIDELNNKTTQDKLNLLKNNIFNRFFTQNCVKNFISSLDLLNNFKVKNENIKIGIFSSYNTNCGVAEYSKYITNELKQKNINYEVFSWNESKEVNMVAQNNPLLGVNTDCNIIWLQHQYGFYLLSKELLHEVKRLKNENKILTITLHATKTILTFTKNIRDLQVEILNEFDRIFVHTIADLNILKRLGIVENVLLMPQGVSVYSIKREKSSVFTIGFFGLLFPHKNLPKLLKAFSEFSKSVDSKLLILSSASNDFGKAELQSCKKIAKNIKNVEWCDEFLPIEEVNQRLAVCDTLFLPYQNSNESSSAAVRTALGICDKVAVSPSEIFNELREQTIQINGFEASDILKTMQDIYQNNFDKNILKNRQEWLKNNVWENIVDEYIKIFQALLIDREFLEYLKNNVS